MELRPPIFLLGAHRSGTTLLQKYFELHPDVVMWFEPRTVWMYADPGRKHDRFDACDATPRVKRYIRRRFLKHQRKHGGRRIVEKTPTNLLRIPYVHEIFPESRFVYIVRHPLAHLSSAELLWQDLIHLRKAWERFLEVPKTQLHYYVGRLFGEFFRKKILRKKYLSMWGTRYVGAYEDIRRMPMHQFMAKQWAESARQAEEDLARLDPDVVLRVRYEDFVQEPVAHFERMMKHFGLTMTPEMARTVAEKTDPGRTSKWTRLEPHVIRDCLGVLEPLMRRYGYELPDLSKLEAMSQEERRQAEQAAHQTTRGRTGF